jgi:hypothetical protein
MDREKMFKKKVFIAGFTKENYPGLSEIYCWDLYVLNKCKKKLVDKKLFWEISRVFEVGKPQ